MDGGGNSSISLRGKRSSDYSKNTQIWFVVQGQLTGPEALKHKNMKDISCTSLCCLNTISWIPLTASVSEDGDPFKEETDVKPEVLPPTAEEDVKVAVDSLLSGSAPSSEGRAAEGE